MNGSDGLLVDTTRRILRDLADPQALNRAPDDAWRGPLWRALDESGLGRAWVPEALGGAAASLSDGFAVLALAGAFALPAPLAETLLAGWLLADAGLAVPDGTLTVAPVRRDHGFTLGPRGTLSGRATHVPFAGDAAHLAVIAPGAAGTVVALLERRQATVVPGRNVAGDPRDVVILDEAVPVAVAPARAAVDELMLMGAAVRASQMAGALQSILDRSVAHANERVAFERPIARFQAIQHALARLAGETAAALAAAGSAADALGHLERDADGVLLEVAAAKIRVGEAAAAGATIAHQVHGAIGFSKEHVLHRFTERLWAWRDDFGTESEWAVRLGNRIAAGGADALWPLLAAR